MDRHFITVEELVGGYLIKSHNSFDKESSYSMVVTDDKSVLEFFNTFLKEKYIATSDTSDIPDKPSKINKLEK